MKKGFLKILPLIAVMGINSTYAEYMIKIPLEQESVTFDDAEVTGSIVLDPTTINRGDSSAIKWEYTYADKLTIQDVGEFYTKTGSVYVNPLTSRSYNVEIVNGDKTRNEILNLTVIQPTQNITFSANPTRIGIGQTSLLNWNVTGASNVAIDNNIGSNLADEGSYSISPTTSTLYTLTASGYEGVSDKTSSVNVEVVPNAIINNFSVNNNKVTKGDSAIFSWNVSNAESLALNPFGPLVEKESGTQSIAFNTIGAFDYTLEATSLSGVKDTALQTINVYNPSIINSFTVNGQKTVDVSPNADLNFAWDTTSASTLKLNGTTVSGTSQLLTANTATGSTTYTLQASNEADYTVSDDVIVNVVGDAVINSFTGPTAVFANSPFSLSWTATGANKYTLKSNNEASGVTITEEDLGTTLTKTTTPTAAGSYTYTLAAYNTANAKTEQNKVVSVEADPTFTGFTVNGQTSINVSPGSALTFAGSGFSTGAILQGRNSTNTQNQTLPSTAPTIAGTTSYYASATKSLNSVDRYSAARSVSVTVVDNPTVSAITSPSAVFEDAAFTMSWSGTNVTNYKIRSNNAASGIPTTDQDLGTATSTPITPTGAGSFTYTVTATNAAGAIATSSKTVAVEANPTFTGFTVNGATSISVSPSTALSFAGSGFSTGSALQARDSGNTVDQTFPTSASTAAGTTTYYGAAKKSLNGVPRYSALRSVSVTVVSDPIIGTITYPTTVFEDVAFTASWSGSNVANYKIRSSNSTSGVATTDENLGTATSKSITPTAPGSYTYTITATNSIGKTTTKSFAVSVVAHPTVSAFSASPTSVVAGGSTTLSWSTANNGTLTINQSVGTVTGTSKSVNVGTTTGTKTYRLTNSRTLNGVTRSAYRDTSISVTSAKVCRYAYSTDRWYFYDDEYSGTGVEIKWGNVVVYDGFQTSSTTTISAGGYKYTRGALKSSSGWDDYYEVCRE